jgi:hypothetical protein
MHQNFRRDKYCHLSLLDRLHWQCFLAKTLATVTEYVLALATLGEATKNRNNLIFCRATQGGQYKLGGRDSASEIALNFTNVNTTYLINDTESIITSTSAKKGFVVKVEGILPRTNHFILSTAFLSAGPNVIKKFIYECS